jgi:hypothetical protein
MRICGRRTSAAVFLPARFVLFDLLAHDPKAGTSRPDFAALR